FKEPRRSDEAAAPSLAQTARNFGTVIANPRFMIFLLIFTGYWIVFWQEFITLPVYIHDYVNSQADTELILVTDSLTVIALQLGMSFLTRELPEFSAIILGTFVTSISWLVLIAHPSVPTAIGAIFVLSLGEIIQAPRYYEYISRLAPSGQQGTYMGFAFLPLGIGSLIAGPIGGYLLHHFGEVKHQPQMMWWIVIGVGLLTTVLLWVYDRSLRATSK